MNNMNGMGNYLKSITNMIERINKYRHYLQDIKITNINNNLVNVYVQRKITNICKNDSTLYT